MPLPLKEPSRSLKGFFAPRRCSSVLRSDISRTSRKVRPRAAAYFLASAINASGISTVVFTSAVYHIYGYLNMGVWVYRTGRFAGGAAIPLMVSATGWTPAGKPAGTTTVN